VARSVGRTDGPRGSPNAPEMTAGLHRHVSLKLAAIVREGASRRRPSFGTRAWRPVVVRGGPFACGDLNHHGRNSAGRWWLFGLLTRLQIIEGGPETLGVRLFDPVLSELIRRQVHRWDKWLRRPARSTRLPTVAGLGERPRSSAAADCPSND
jgi:hypothetical protein